MTIEEIFGQSEDGLLTFEEFEQLAKEGKCKFADLSEGEYISANKHSSEVENLKNQIQALNETLATRDEDLSSLQEQLKEAGDGYVEIDALNGALKDLQGKYEADVTAYKEQLKKQEYEFAAKEFANTKKFSSNAAKRDFTQSLIAKGLEMKDGEIVGVEDFAKTYSMENEDAFYTEPKAPAEPPKAEPKPTFISSTPGTDLGSKPSLTEMMMFKNENPELNINF